VAEQGDAVVVSYEGTLTDGKIFDSATKFDFTIGAGEVIKVTL
jgi:FKBP-type peptidyl-prolyl cis-trans isomerase